MPRCGGSTPSRTSSTGISRRSRGTGCGQACREGGAPLAAGACGRVLLDGGGGHQGERFRRVADRCGSGVRRYAGDPRADPRSPTPVELARGARGPGLRGRRAAVRVREQADHGGQYRFPPGDESAVRRSARAVAVARARAGGRPGVHGGVGSWPRPAVRRRAATFRDRAGSLPRQRARGGERAGMGIHGDGLPLAGPPGALPLAAGRATDWLIVIYLGVFQLGLAYVFLSRAITRVPALEASLFLLVEPVLSPVWAWLAHGETPGPLAVIGGAVILTATALKAWTDTQVVAA